ncbi:efflux RND transporter periplasmic adaptor subunit [bacterium]|nr:efflux RND transporter periplasmic adaptor subunit [bacterium]
MKLNTKNLSLIVVAVCVIGAGAYFFINGQKAPVDFSYETAKVEKATIESSVTATGTIEAVTQVEVGTQVSGIIDKIYVDYNSVVHKGQVIAELDKSNLVSEMNSAVSQLQSAQSDLNYQQSNFKRMKTLFDKGLISANDYESARLTLEQAQSLVAQRREAVTKAKTNLGYATITSPIDGIVLGKSVEEGQTVASSFNTPTLFTIVKDMTDMRVIANVDEADIGQVREGQRVTYTVDAYPNEVFEGTVTQVRNQATTESNVVTYEVVISAPNPDLKLKPGLTANVTIFTLEQTGIVSVPTKALRYTPTKETIGPKDKIVDCQGTQKLWVREGNTFKAYAVKTGITNGTRTQILSGVKEGTAVIVDLKEQLAEEQAGADNAEAGTQEKSPFAPGPRGKKK